MEPVFSQPVRAAHIKDVTQTHVITAGPAARAALAKLYGLLEIPLLRGEFELRHERAGIIAASLNMHAKIVQTCVVSLEPFESRLDETSELRFVLAASLPEAEGVELDPEALEAPDEIPYTGDIVDLGSALAEQLALSLDPYPRRPGAELPPEATPTAENPFGLLKFRK